MSCYVLLVSLIIFIRYHRVINVFIITIVGIVTVSGEVSLT